MKIQNDNTHNLAALKPVLQTLLGLAKKQGADAAEVTGTHGLSVSIGARGGELEDIENSENKDIGLRVFVGKRQACVSSSDLSKSSLEQLAERVTAMAKLAPEDPYCGLAASEKLVTHEQIDELDLETDDPINLQTGELFSRAKELEAAALSVQGVQQVEGANAYMAKSSLYFMTSDGFSMGRSSSQHGLSVSAIASDGSAMERDYDYQSTRWFEDLRKPKKIGTLAGERAIARLGAKKLKSGNLPVLFDTRVSSQLLNALLGAISGPAITRGISFLKDDLGKPLFSKNINITDDPFIKRGASSHLWDGEGVFCNPLKIIKEGVLHSWLLHSASARQLGLKTTGHATHSISSPPGVSATNAFIHNGDQSPKQVMKDIGEGLFISEMFGPSLNTNTGDYSVGIAGFAIENGAKTYPVSEVTIAGNLKDMFASLIACNDLKREESVNAPSLLIPNMVIAGE